MHKWIDGRIGAAALLAVASAASAQPYPQTSGNRAAASAAERITVTGCVTQGAIAAPTVSANRPITNGGGWVLSNATGSSSGTDAINPNQSAEASRSGSPSNEGATAANRNGTTGTGVSGSTSTVRGTSGTSSATGSIDSEAHGGGVGATDQAGSTVGAGATAGATRGDRSGATSANGASSYQLTGISNPNEFANKRVEIIGTLDSAPANAGSRKPDTSAKNAMPVLRIASVRVLGDSCQ